MPIRGLIFDFDGLILDTELPDYEAWREEFALHGAELPLDVWLPMIGVASESWDPHDYLDAQTDVPVDRTAARTRRRTRMLEMIAEQNALPGVMALIADAKGRGIKIAVASSSGREWVTGHLRRLGLDVHFDAVRTKEDVHAAKPDPALYLSALAALGIAADEAIAFEDSANGSIAAVRAGIFTVAVPNAMTRTLDFSHVNLVLPSLDALSLDELIAHADATHTIGK